MNPCPRIKPRRSGRVLRRGESKLEEQESQSSTRGFIRTWRSTETVFPIASGTKRYYSLRLRRIRRHLERAMGWEPGVCEGFPAPGGGQYGQDQTGVWQFPFAMRE